MAITFSSSRTIILKRLTFYKPIIGMYLLYVLFLKKIEWAKILPQPKSTGLIINKNTIITHFWTLKPITNQKRTT